MVRGEEGFTLTELLVTIVIVGVIGSTLTGAVILGFRTTDATGARVARSSAIQALTSYFTEDAQRAQTVTVLASPAVAEPAGCATGDEGRFLRLDWADGSDARTVVYALDPPTGTAHQLTRWVCVGAGGPVAQNLGRFVHADGAGLPVVAECVVATCVPDVAGTPEAVTLLIQSDPSAGAAAPARLTVRRRAS